jgi:hypothetical protein
MYTIDPYFTEVANGICNAFTCMWTKESGSRKCLDCQEPSLVIASSSEVFYNPIQGRCCYISLMLDKATLKKIKVDSIKKIIKITSTQLK